MIEKGKEILKKYLESAKSLIYNICFTVFEYLYDIRVN